MDSQMIPSFLDLASGELRITLVVCSVSLVAVLVPLVHGARLCLRARAATASSVGKDAPAGSRVAELTEGVLASAEAQLSTEDASSLPFVRDAAKQLVVDDYETSFSQPISMYANLLPPIGFIGTTCGLAVLLVSMRISHEGLQLGALALALSSTIFALVGYALLEGMKIHLYTRLARSIDAGMNGTID